MACQSTTPDIWAYLSRWLAFQMIYIGTSGLVLMMVPCLFASFWHFSGIWWHRDRTWTVHQCTSNLHLTLNWHRNGVVTSSQPKSKWSYQVTPGYLPGGYMAYMPHSWSPDLNDYLHLCAILTRLPNWPIDWSLPSISRSDQIITVDPAMFYSRCQWLSFVHLFWYIFCFVHVGTWRTMTSFA